MFADDWASLLYLSLMLLFIGGALLVEYSGRAGQTLRHASLWAVIVAGLMFIYYFWIDDRRIQPQITADGQVEIPVSPDGHFYLTARLNGEPVRFVIDTGASTVALSPDDAQRIGIQPDNLAYFGRAYTANGVVRTADVTIREFVIGEMVEYDVPAAVIDGDLSGSLLGMDYLRRFARVTFEDDLLILER